MAAAPTRSENPSATAADFPPRSRVRDSLELLEKATKIAGILAIFGYMSLRAQMNHLGIPFTSSLDLEGYLREAYSLVLGLLDAFREIAVVAVLLAFLAGILWLFAAALVWFTALGRRWRQRPSYRWDFLDADWFPGAILLLLGVFYLWLLRSVADTWRKSDVVVGKLDADRLQPQDAHGQYILLILVSMLTYALYRAAIQRRNAAARSRVLLDSSQAGDPWDGRPFKLFLWRLLALAAAALALHIPLLDGLSQRDVSFRQVVVIPDKSKTEMAPVCGLLALRTAADLVVWQAHNGVGQVQVIPREKVQTVISGQVRNLLEAAREAANYRAGDVPQCPGGLPSDPANTGRPAR